MKTKEEYYSEYYDDYCRQFNWGQDITNDLEDENYYYQLSNLESKIKENVNSIKKELQYYYKDKKLIEEILKDIKKLESEFEKAKKEALKKWLEYKCKNEKTRYLTIPKEFIGEYFYKVS